MNLKLYMSKKRKPMKHFKPYIPKEVEFPVQSDHNFDLECRIIIDFRSSAKESIIKRFSRIEGFKYRFLFAK